MVYSGIVFTYIVELTQAFCQSLMVIIKSHIFKRLKIPHSGEKYLVTALQKFGELGKMKRADILPIVCFNNTVTVGCKNSHFTG